MNGFPQSTLARPDVAENLARSLDDIQTFGIGGDLGGCAAPVNNNKLQELFEYSSVRLTCLVKQTASWVSGGIASHGKPTHFEVSDRSI